MMAAITAMRNAATQGMICSYGIDMIPCTMGPIKVAAGISAIDKIHTSR
jgi:hypothetical protein